ncbi:hypothetical protein, partial [Sphingomonas sp. IW22]|uniref:hypothetical protein n=1 Tax=Sphingomonas sp. IW22 TaxID=3242489 RepID=UPI00352146D4
LKTITPRKLKGTYITLINLPINQSIQLISLYAWELERTPLPKIMRPSHPYLGQSQRSTTPVCNGAASP